MKIISKFIFIIMILIIVLVSSALAEVPNSILFQGILKDKTTGQLINSNNLSLTLTLYTDAAGQNAVQPFPFTNVKVVNGVYSVTLTPNSADIFNQQLYVKVEADGAQIGSELFPIHSSPSAIYAKKANTAVDADKLDGEHKSFFQNASNITSGALDPQRIGSQIAGQALSQSASGSLNVNIGDGLIIDNPTNKIQSTPVSIDGITTKPANLAISSGASDSLKTNNKTSIVSAINELYNSRKILKCGTIEIAAHGAWNDEVFNIDVSDLNLSDTNYFISLTPCFNDVYGITPPAAVYCIFAKNKTNTSFKIFYHDIGSNPNSNNKIFVDWMVVK